ncbi:MAG: hypothetical protein Q8936_14325 [Bacillota bacterium]|nr:hypothetical protein [Bacillota bacterium]
MDDQNLSSQGQDGLAGEVMESLGESKDVPNEETQEAKDEGGETLPDGVKDRLWRQERKHQREMRNMKAQFENLQSQMSQNSRAQPEANPYANDGQPSSVDEQIHKAVSYALQHKEMEERKAKEAERMQHVHKQYQELHKHLDDTSDKYDDFEDTVRGENAPFTPHMRDAALLLPRKGAGSAGEVLYKLGKNPSELDRISKLHPLDQAAEVVAMSHALINGADTKTSTPRPLGQIKSNPVTNTHAVTDKTPVGDLRKRMKGWKGH